MVMMLLCCSAVVLELHTGSRCLSFRLTLSETAWRKITCFWSKKNHCARREGIHLVTVESVLPIAVVGPITCDCSHEICIHYSVFARTSSSRSLLGASWQRADPFLCLSVWSRACVERVGRYFQTLTARVAGMLEDTAEDHVTVTPNMIANAGLVPGVDTAFLKKLAHTMGAAVDFQGPLPCC